MTFDDSVPKKFALTTPLYYVNDVPHVGSAYTTMVADVIARYKRLRGYEVLLITGTDEHGQKIQRTAQSNNLTPQAHCDRIVTSFEKLWYRLNIQYDRFSRTTAAPHSSIVREFFERVWQQGDIYLDRQQGWYCVACEEFKEERDLLPEHHCPLHPTLKVEWRDEENYFFRLSKYQTALETLYKEHPDFIEPETRRNEVLSFVAQGLKDFSISRVNLDWGFPVPNDPQHTIYVWFDALLGYVTALIEPGETPSLENALKKWWPINLHVIGKDILRFHAVYWPAMLLSAQLPLPDKVFGHGFLTKDGQKMSKSTGNTLDPVALVERYGADAIRYYFLKEIELGRDGDFSESRFVQVVNADLANDLGNLLNRTLGMLKKYCGSVGPQLNKDHFAADHPLRQCGETLAVQINHYCEVLRFDLVCQEIFTLVRAGNKYIDDCAPWALFKQEQQEKVEEILYAVLESIRLSAFLLAPIIPSLSNEIYRQLGYQFDFNDLVNLVNEDHYFDHFHWGVLSANPKLSPPQPIFTRLELPSIESAS